jgi:nucleoside 2-deoxyribosyltransferase
MSPQSLNICWHKDIIFVILNKNINHQIEGKCMIKKVIWLLFMVTGCLFAKTNISQPTLPLNNETDHFKLYCMANDKESAQKVLEVSEKNFSKLSTDFKYEYSTKINLYVFSSVQAHHDAIGESNAENWLVNFVDKDTNSFFTVSPDNPGSYHTAKNILRLNIVGLTDLFVMDINPTTPGWLCLGVGLWMAGLVQEAGLSELAGNHALIPSFQQLKGHAKEHDTQRIWQNCAYSVVEFINHRWGWEKILALLADFSSFERILGLTQEAFRHEWISCLDATYKNAVRFENIKKEDMKNNRYNIYFAGDLFDQKHITGNLLLARQIEIESNNYYKCILPQDWEGLEKTSVDIRNKDIKSVAQADLVIFNFDGTDLDSGTVVEFMIAKMLDIPAVLLRTDFRNGGYLFGDDWNLMVAGYPRCAVVKYPALMTYNSLGLEEMHRAIAKEVISALKKVAQEKTLMDSYEEIFSAYQHVIKMCGAGLVQMIDPQMVHTIIASKIEKNIYAFDVPPQKNVIQKINISD